MPIITDDGRDRMTRALGDVEGDTTGKFGMN
jgi:hypothetical protein